MSNNISVSLFRVSSDSKYLDMIFDCPLDYYFNNLQITAKFFVNGSLKTQMFDLSLALFIINKSDADGSTEKSTVKQKHWTVRIPLNKLGINFPAIYEGTLQALAVYSPYAVGSSYAWPAPYSNCKDDSGNPEFSITSSGSTWFVTSGSTFITENNGEYVPCIPVTGLPTDLTIETLMVCSDVNFAYRCMLDDILALEDPCLGLSENAIRNFLILYGHLAALNARDFEIAERYFSIITKCFTNCNNSSRLILNNSLCNCSK